MAPAPVSAAAPRPSVPAFDRVARAYQWMEALSFGRALSRTREEYLPLLVAARHALVLGDGDGRFIAALLRRNVDLRAVSIDASGRMLQLLQARCKDAGDRLTLLQTDLRDGQLPGCGATYDLVVSHFFLDCLDEDDLALLVREICLRLRPGALWVNSEFRVPPEGPLRLPAMLLVRGLYLAFGLLTGLSVRALPSYAAILRESGFHLRVQRLRLGGLLTAELWQWEQSSNMNR